MTKIIVDCFGSDHSPEAQIHGSIQALEKYSDLYLILSGDEAILKQKLGENLTKYSDRIEILNAPEVITGNDEPNKVVRMSKESSMMKAVRLLKEDDSISGMVSCGATGALVAAGVLRIGRAKGVIRPPFCPILPTMAGGVVGVCDSGAVTNCNPEILQQFAIMGSLYMQNVYGIENPKVALLNIGTEEHKGDELRQKTFQLLKDTQGINFVGNMESRDLLTGKYDLVVCDGFSGNVLVKTTEGTALELLKKLKKGIFSRLSYKIGGLFLKGLFTDFKNTMDYQNYGGSILLGVNKTMVKGHGSSKAKAVEKCIEQAYMCHRGSINDKIEKQIEINTPEMFR